MPRLGFLLVAAFLLAGLSLDAQTQTQAQASASAFVQDLADRAVANLTDAERSSEEREDRIRELFRQGFAVRGIAKFTLGRYWRSASEEQRREYLALFEDVIVDAWAARFTKYSGQRFEIREESRVSGGGVPVVIVRSLIWASPESPIRVNWRVASAGEIYKITDVIVEGISMATTQRDEFASLVRKDGLNGLLASLREKGGRDGKLAALVGAQQFEILPAGGRPPALPEQEPVSVPSGALAIQLASLRSSARAQTAWETLLVKYPALLGNRDLSIERVDLAERGVFYRVRTGTFAVYAEAFRMCQQFADLDQDCLVVQR